MKKMASVVQWWRFSLKNLIGSYRGTIIHNYSVSLMRLNRRVCRVLERADVNVYLDSYWVQLGSLLLAFGNNIIELRIFGSQRARKSSDVLPADGQSPLLS